MNPMALPLPPLVARSAIEPQHVLAVGAIYAAFELEQMKLFTVTDRVVELSQQGLLPISRTNASRALSRYWQDRPNRLTEHERRSVYAQALGKGGDEHSPLVNRDFNDLWIRFLSAVSARSRQRPVPGQRPAVKVSPAAVRKAARDLAANLSLHGWGVGYFAASRLQQHITQATDILSSSDIRSALGARNMWHVVERVAANDLGGAVNTAKYRTMATSGLEIIRWLAGQGTAGRGSKPRNGLPSRAVVQACEEWLTASGGNGEDGDNG
jgi:hypothetical protein